MRFRVSSVSTLSRFVYNEETNTEVDLANELANALTKKYGKESSWSLIRNVRTSTLNVLIIGILATLQEKQTDY